MIQKIKQAYKQPINGSQIYLTILAVYFVFSFLQNTTFENYIGSRPFNIVSYLTFAILIFKIYFFDHYNWMQNIGIGILLLLSVIVWRKTGANIIMVMTAFILAAQNVNFESIIKIYFNINLWLLLAVIACSLLGIINNLSFVVQGRGTRYALGIIYPTDFAARVLYLMLADAYLHFKKLTYTRYFIYLLIAIICKQITDARLNFYCMLLLIVALMIASYAQGKYNESRLDWSNHVVSTFWAFTPILATTTIFGTYLYNPANQLYLNFDHLLSGRLTFGNMAFQKYQISLLGNKIKEHGYGNNMKLFKNGIYNYFFIDSSFIRLIIIFGILATIIFAGLTMYISIKNLHYGYYALPTILLIVTISAVVEQHFLELTYNPFLLSLMATIALGNNTKRKDSFS